MARIDHREVLTRYLAGAYVPALDATLRRLPADIDVELATRVVVRLLTPTQLLRCKAIPAHVIRAVLAREVPGATHVFLRLAVPADLDDALTTGDSRLDMLARLRTHATNAPAFDRMFADVAAALDVRDDLSPARALGTIIGLADAPLLHFDVDLLAAAASAQVCVDSRVPCWFSVRVMTIEEGAVTSFTSEPGPHPDALGLGHCPAWDLPRWLARAAVTLRTTWYPPEIRSTNLRGKNRDALLRWLQPHAKR